MTIQTTTSVRDLAVGIPGATRIFEQHRIDYCCGGAKSLADACASVGADPKPIVAELEAARVRAVPGDIERWAGESMDRLAAYIIDKHHTYVRTEIARLMPLLDKIVRVHGERHPEFAAMRTTFAALADELGPHLMKEENILFPYIVDLDRASRGLAPKPPCPFGTVQNPVRMMAMEHDSAGDLLRELRAQTRDYTPPEDGCGSVRAVFAGLAAFERDLHEHIHLESNVLFPRAIEAERR
jgi:regulator of cell morphogenesis and NO signaling